MGASSPYRMFAPGEDLEELHLSAPLQATIETLARELRYVDRFVAAGVDPPTRILFSGPSGTGKTLAGRWLASRMKCHIAIADVASVIGSHVGESAQGLAKCFDAIQSQPKAILFLDEVDAICANRATISGGAAADELARVTTTFFQRVDWLPKTRIVIAATNFFDELDPALRRRLTTQIAFTHPDRDARRAMLEQWLSKAPLCPEQLDMIADDTDGLTGAELRAHAMAAARRAIMAGPPEKPKAKGKIADEDRTTNVAGAQALLRLVDGIGGQ